MPLPDDGWQLCRNVCILMLLALMPSLAESETAPSFERSDVTITYSPELFLLQDFNKDGTIDIISANKNGGMSLLFGNGDGTFQKERMIVIGNTISVMVAEDFNLDGNLDILVNGWTLFGDGKGNFTKTGHSVGVNNMTITGDINADGIPDLLSGQSASLGKGDGTFKEPYTIAPSDEYYFTPGYIHDFNGDGIPDVVATYTRTDVTASIFVLSIFLGNTDGSFTESMITSASSFYAYFPAYKDFNRDNNSDVLWITGDYGYTSLFLNNGDGSFTLSSNIMGNIPDSQFCRIFSLDFDSDKIPDLGVLSYFYDTHGILSFFRGKGDGTFGERITGDTTIPFQTVDIKDLNNDGLDDFIIGDGSRGLISIYIKINKPTGVQVQNDSEFVTVSPNPANPVTTITYSIKAHSSVKLFIYSVNGQKVATLVDGPASAGRHSVKFDGSKYASGVYLYRFESAGLKTSGKMLLLK